MLRRSRSTSESQWPFPPFLYKGIPAICIDLEHSDRYPELARFTLAEELGHLLLHAEVYRKCATLEQSIERYLELPPSDIDRMDRNVRYVGAAILVPQRRLAEDLDDFLQRGNARVARRNAVSRIQSLIYHAGPSTQGWGFLGLGPTSETANR